MTYFTNWDEFAKSAERLQASNPEKCRLVSKYNHRDGKMIIKVTDDVVCLQFSTNQMQDVKRFEKLSATMMRNAIAQ
ncbi:unnamed protein product [Auanema sp. JU1783]|nr:unnamed protein product [Auanema sp. JU1783]